MTGHSKLSHIYAHSKFEHHQQKLIENNLHNISQLDEPTTSFDERRKSAEIRFAALMSEKNIPYNVANDILNFFKEIGKDKNVLQSMKVSRTKCTNIITNVLCPIETENVVESIKKTPFSVFIDETSDISNKKWMTFFIRYVDAITLDVQCRLLKLINIDAKDCSAEKLFEYFKEEMERLNIPFTNIIGYACDNASVMTGKNMSFKTMLQKKCKNLITFPCICHSSALVANAACNKIPDICEDFIKKISTYINNSPKRSAIYDEIHEAFQEKKHKILKLCDTRWLCRYTCIERILNSWNSIEKFLREMVVCEKTTSAQELLSIVENVDIKAYFLFLKYVLNLFNAFNAFFQSYETRVHLLRSKSVELLKNLSENFIMEPLMNYYTEKINFSATNNLKPIDRVYLGPECENYITDLRNKGHADIVLDIKNHCLQFYITAATEIKKRFPINDEFLTKLEVLKSESALLGSNRNDTFNNISVITEKTLEKYQEEDLKMEWILLYSDTTDEEKTKFAQLNFDEMWKNILKTNNNGTVKYPNLTKLLSAVRCLPHSNADPERTFSVLSDLKTIKRNRFSENSVNSTCVFKNALKAKKFKAINMEITEKHINLMNSKDLYKTVEKKNQNSLTLYPANSDNEDVDDPEDSNK
ncbi:zinc finger protein 862-like [Prorops nasuta]|uniref:zinc finger protein 862-like n=1 Tax=Prorops nasuta TaxID=863751 RepID=UPI0034D00587